MKNDASGDATAVAGTNLADSGDVGSSRGGVAREETVVQVAAVVTSEGDPNDQQRHTQPTKAVVMGKHNGEDYDESAQERMLKEDSAPKISPVKDSTEVREKEHALRERIPPFLSLHHRDIKVESKLRRRLSIIFIRRRSDKN